MKKTIAALLTASMVFAFAFTLVGSVGAQTLDATSTTSGTVTGDSSTVLGDDTTSPGLPDTGAGGDSAMNIAILLSSGLLAVGATVLLARKFAA